MKLAISPFAVLQDSRKARHAHLNDPRRRGRSLRADGCSRKRNESETEKKAQDLYPTRYTIASA